MLQIYALCCGYLAFDRHIFFPDHAPGTRMTIPEDGKLWTGLSSPPPLAQAVVRATTALDRAVGVEPPWMSHS